MSYLFFSSKIASYLVKKAKLNNEKEEVLAYAIEVLSLNLINIGMALLIGYMLGVIPGTIICLIIVTIIRTFAGGAHSNSPWRCAVITSLVFPVMALLAQELVHFDSNILDIFLGVAIITGFVTVFVLAPVDSPNAPIVSDNRRIRLKKLSLLSVIIICAIAVFIRYSIPNKMEILLCIGFAVLWSSFILTNTGHIFFKAIDCLKILKRREV